MEGQVAAPHPKGLEAANLEVLESVGLEGLEAAVGSNLEGLEAVVETNLEGLEAVVGTNLEVPAVASWRARRWRPGGPGSSSKEMRRRCGGPGGWPGGGPGRDGPGGGGRLGDPAVERTDLRPAAQPTRDSLWNRFNKVDLSFRRLNGRPDVWQLGVMVQIPNAALNYTSVSYSP
ncbi:unnamed protein product [Boreogadus saida]